MAQQAVDSMKASTLFDKINNATSEENLLTKKKATANSKENMDEFYVPDGGDGEGKATKKKLSIERIYQKKTQLEHILLRPDTYIGSIESVSQPMWVLDEDGSHMVLRDITYVPGLYKIFDEILVNAADNKQRDPNMNCIKIDIDPANNKIKIWNNGRGIPVVEHKEHKMFVPTMIFGHLLTSSNYDDSEKKVTGGRNGYGAKLCNIFSKKFIIETSYKECKQGFRQTWTDNMQKTKEPTITDAKEDDFTAVTFYPDLEKFKMDTLDKDTVDLFTRRAYDIAGACKGVKVILNGKRVPIKNFNDYVNLFVKDKVDEAGAPIKVVHEIVNDRWEVAVTMSEKGFQQASFVNSIATTKGGRHIDHVADQVVKKLIEVVAKKNKGGIQIKPFQVKNHLWVFVNCQIENPTFDSQTKENMTLQPKAFGSKCALSEKFITQVSKCGIIESILSWMKFKAQAELSKKCSSSKQNKLKGVPKLDDANDAGTRHSLECTLILTEGDSAKSLAVAGLGVIGRDRYGVFPLRGKVLNVREATHKQIMENAEINNVVKIMGLQFNKKYTDPGELKTLRYGKLMIMTDQDQDGSHIKGLLINFIQHFWPNLLKQNVVVQFITPIVKVTKGHEELSFYSLPEFEEWKQATSNWNTWKIKYYKGLGTSTAKEAKEYFSDMNRHKIEFKYGGAEDDASINLAFNKKKVEERKEWLLNWMEEKKRRAEMGLPGLYLYGKNTKTITFNDFINRELILFSNMDLERSIPSLVDGLKPGQRKVLFTCLKRNLVNKEIKVAQLAGSVAELSAYHHGEASLMSTIVNLAQTFVGSNNLNLLQPIGQFGTRLHGGKDASSPRYIFTMLSPLTRILFNINDEPLLNYLYDDNLRIEPEWYCPIIPMVLVNGAEGIGTGWSTKIPNYDIREIVANIKRLIDGEDPQTMLPSYKNFKGTIVMIGDNRYIVNGEISVIDDQTVEITELPIRKWTQDYKEDVMEPMMTATEKQPQLIMDYKEYHTDTTVKFQIKMTSENLAKSEEIGLHKVFKLQNSLTTNSMVLFDRYGGIKRYNSVEEILREFYDLRLEMYRKRKSYLEGVYAAESLKMDNIARFIMEKIAGTVSIEDKKKKDLIEMLVRRKYDSDPVKAWKAAQNKGKTTEEDLNEDHEDQESGPDFNYILSMPLWNLTNEKKEELLAKRDAKAKELMDLRRKSPMDLWKDDLEQFLEELDKVEQQERDDDAVGMPGGPTKGKSSKVVAKKVKKALPEVKPTPMSRRVEPKIDSAMKRKAEGPKVKKEKKDGNILDFVKIEDESSEPMSLADRLKLKGSPVDAIKGEKKVMKAKEPKEKAPRAKKASGSPSKRGKKRNPWSDDSAESDIEALSDTDMDGSFIGTVIPRDGPKRAAAQKAKYTFDLDDEIESEESETEIKTTTDSKADAAATRSDNSDDESFKMSGDGSDDSDFKVAKKTKAPAKKASSGNQLKAASNAEIGAAVIAKKPEVAKKKVAPKESNLDLGAPNRYEPTKKKKAIVDSDSDTSIACKKNETAKRKAPIFDSDSDISSAPQKAIPAKKRAAVKSDSDSEFSGASDNDVPKSASTNDDEWLRITGKAPEKASQSTMDKQKTKDSEPIMFDESDNDDKASAPVEQLYKPIKSLKPADDKSKAKKPAGEKKPRAPKKTTENKEPKDKKTAGKKKKNPWSDDSDDEKPKKKTVKKRPTKTNSDLEDSSDDKEKAPKKSKKSASTDDEFEVSGLDGDISIPPPVSRGGRARAPVKYNFGDSDSEDFE